MHLKNGRNRAYTLYSALHLWRSFIPLGSFWANTTKLTDCQSVTFTLYSSKWGLVAIPRSRFPMEGDWMCITLNRDSVYLKVLKELRRKIQVSFTDDCSRVSVSEWVVSVFSHIFISLYLYSEPFQGMKHISKTESISSWLQDIVLV